MKEINVNPGNLTQEKELTKIGYRQGENGKKKREREREAKLTTAKSIEFKWREEWNYQCKHPKKLKEHKLLRSPESTHTYYPTTTNTKEADHIIKDYKKEK